MPGALEGRVALVTGGGWNIGRAIALRFAEEGARVAVCGRREPLLRETADRIRTGGGEALHAVADVTELASIEAAAGQALARWGRIDVLVACAGGGGGHEPIDAIDPATWEAVVRVNLIGTFHSVRAVLPAMRRQRSGAIVTLSGGGAYFPQTEVPSTAYAAAKAGVCRLTDQLAYELLDSGIRVNCLQPGLVWSEDALAAAAERERRAGRPDPARARNHAPEEAAELALWLASDRSAPLSGRLVAVDDPWWRTAGPEERAGLQASLHAWTLRRVEAPR